MFNIVPAMMTVITMTMTVMVMVIVVMVVTLLTIVHDGCDGDDDHDLPLLVTFKSQNATESNFGAQKSL